MTASTPLEILSIILGGIGVAILTSVGHLIWKAGKSLTDLKRVHEYIIGREETTFEPGIPSLPERFDKLEDEIAETKQSHKDQKKAIECIRQSLDDHIKAEETAINEVREVLKNFDLKPKNEE